MYVEITRPLVVVHVIRIDSYQLGVIESNTVDSGLYLRRQPSHFSARSFYEEHRLGSSCRSLPLLSR